MSNERKFAGTSIEIDGVVVAKITSFNVSSNTSEIETTGSEDVMPGSDILNAQFQAVKQDSTLALEGIAMIGDTGQDDLRTAAEAASIVELERIYQDGTGHVFTGYLTNFTESGSVQDGVYKFSTGFRVNSKVAIV